MKILHLSDLHLSAPWRSLEEVWIAPAALLAGEQPFDFIVVSGDLSERSGADEYQRLHDFTLRTLLPLLRHPDERRRVIFVPGNHDTQWGATASEGVFRQVSLADALQRDPQAVARAIRDARERPESTAHRFSVSALGHGELFEVDPAKRYADRFAAVQGFLDRFYEGELTSPWHRAFDLLGAGPGGDWSAHAFPAENVLFIGLNSCATNDRFWAGARFAPEAIAQAQKHVAGFLGNTPSATVVAVWHHGFASEPGRPDRLAMGDLGMVYNMGARVGFHGHCHVADGAELDMLDGRMAVVATGSLAAGGAELPEGVGNQLSICELGRGRVSVRAYTLDHQKRRFELQPRTRRLRFGEEVHRAERAVPRCARQRRLWRLNEDGIACVTVQLAAVQPCATVELDTVAPPYCAVAAREARVGARSVAVTERVLEDGRRRFFVQLDNERPVDVLWTYYVSNGAAITAEELPLLPERGALFEGVEPTEEVRAHVNRLECDELELLVAFGAGAPAPAGARAIVERRAADRGEDPWQLDDQESRRATAGVLRDGRTVRVAIAEPMPGHRYSLVYVPGRSGRPMEREPLAVAEKVVDLCRGVVEPHVGARLTEAISAALLSEGLTASTWAGHVWSQERRRLLTAFGRFPPQSWAARFACGDGIAGHAFRHSYPVAWTRRMAQRTGDPFINVVYRVFPDNAPLTSNAREWVLAIPLFLGRDGPSLGVVSFSGGTSARDRKMAALTEQIAARHGATSGRPAPTRSAMKTQAGSRAEAKLKGLVLVLNMAFWTTLAEARELEADERDLCARIRDGLVRPVTPRARRH